MTRSMRALTFLVAVGFAVPAIAGQAVPRTTGTSSSSGSGGATASGGTSSGSSGSSGSSSSGSSTAPSGSSTYGGESRSTPSRIASGNSSRTSTGTATVRVAPPPGGVSSGGGTDSSSSSSRVGDASLGLGASAYARSRNGQPITGAAAPRPLIQPGVGGGDLVAFPFYGPWGLWYPWYGGFGWNMGYVTYNPWYYGATSWYWGPYGMWYDPYSYMDPYRYGGGAYREREPKVEKTTGSLRIKANLESAKVYIDNALVGLVEEFDGINDRLEVDGGRHKLELRADGYETKVQEINVKVGQTRTLRINLKKK